MVPIHLLLFVSLSGEASPVLCLDLSCGGSQPIATQIQRDSITYYMLSNL